MATERELRPLMVKAMGHAKLAAWLRAHAQTKTNMEHRETLLFEADRQSDLAAALMDEWLRTKPIPDVDGETVDF